LVNNYEQDFSDVRGQENVKRALEIAAAGGHNIMQLGMSLFFDLFFKISIFGKKEGDYETIHSKFSNIIFFGQLSRT